MSKHQKLYLPFLLIGLLVMGTFSVRARQQASSQSSTDQSQSDSSTTTKKKKKKKTTDDTSADSTAAQSASMSWHTSDSIETQPRIRCVASASRPKSAKIRMSSSRSLGRVTGVSEQRAGRTYVCRRSRKNAVELSKWRSDVNPTDADSEFPQRPFMGSGAPFHHGDGIANAS